MVRNILLIAVMLLICSVANAGDTDWLWNFGQGYSAYFGTSSLASNDIDAQDIKITNTQYWYYGTYHEHNVEGWTGDTGFYSTDIRAPLPLVPGESVTWTFFLWGDSLHNSHLELMWGYGPVTPVFSKMQYSLTYVRAAQGVTGSDISEGTSAILNDYPQGTWSFPSYNTTDGRTGYMFALTATVIPEPSSLLALVGGLAGVGGFVLRRRRKGH